MTDASHSFRGAAIRGVAWTTGGHVTSTLLQVGVVVVLARLLTPRDFGLVGMITVFSGFGAVFATLGFPNALIHRAHVEEGHRSTAFWTTLTISLCVWGILSATGPLIAQLYSEPALPLLIVVATTAIPLNALGSVHRALLSRDMRFNSLVVIETSSIAVGAAIAIALAAAGAGVWSLVTQPATAGLFGSILAWRIHRWRPTTMLSRSHFRDLLAFGGHATGFSAVNYWVRQGDDFLIGLRVGASPLGLYSRAYTILLLPIQNVAQILGRVMFPVMARLQKEPDRLKRAYLQAVNIIAITVFPAMAGLYAVAPDFVVLVFGLRWAGMVPFVEIFAILGIGQAIGTTVGWLFQALGRMKHLFIYGLSTAPLLLGSFVVGSLWGAEGVAVAYAATSFLLLPISIWVAGRPVALGPISMVRHVWRPAVAAALMAIVIRGVAQPWMEHLPVGARLAFQVVFGILIYAGTLLLIARPAVREMWSAVRELRPKAVARGTADRDSPPSGGD